MLEMEKNHLSLKMLNTDPESKRNKRHSKMYLEKDIKRRSLCGIG